MYAGTPDPPHRRRPGGAAGSGGGGVSSGLDVEKSVARFKTRICVFWLQPSGCPYAGRCLYAHGRDEIRDHGVSTPQPAGGPDVNPRFKTRMCRWWADSDGACPHGMRCAFAHGFDELVVDARADAAAPYPPGGWDVRAAGYAPQLQPGPAWFPPPFPAAPPHTSHLPHGTHNQQHPQLYAWHGGTGAYSGEHDPERGADERPPSDVLAIGGPGGTGAAYIFAAAPPPPLSLRHHAYATAQFASAGGGPGGGGSPVVQRPPTPPGAHHAGSGDDDRGSHASLDSSTAGGATHGDRWRVASGVVGVSATSSFASGATHRTSPHHSTAAPAAAGGSTDSPAMSALSSGTADEWAHRRQHAAPPPTPEDSGHAAAAGTQAASEDADAGGSGSGGDGRVGSGGGDAHARYPLPSGPAASPPHWSGAATGGVPAAHASAPRGVVVHAAPLHAHGAYAPPFLSSASSGRLQALSLPPALLSTLRGMTPRELSRFLNRHARAEATARGAGAAAAGGPGASDRWITHHVAPAPPPPPNQQEQHAGPFVDAGAASGGGRGAYTYMHHFGSATPPPLADHGRQEPRLCSTPPLPPQPPQSHPAQPPQPAFPAAPRHDGRASDAVPVVPQAQNLGGGGGTWRRGADVDGRGAGALDTTWPPVTDPRLHEAHAVSDGDATAGNAACARRAVAARGAPDAGGGSHYTGRGMALPAVSPTAHVVAEPAPAVPVGAGGGWRPGPLTVSVTPHDAAESTRLCAPQLPALVLSPAARGSLPSSLLTDMQ